MGIVLERIAQFGVLPVVNIADPAWTDPLSNALVRSGLPLIEVTLREKTSMESLRRLAGDKRLLVGAGTVLTHTQMNEALDAGAAFIVTPGYDQALVDECRMRKIPLVPGCTTATDVQKATVSGLNVVKFFPAERCGGLQAIRDLSGPFSGMRFIPTGGITMENLGSYLKCPLVAACGGSFAVSTDMLRRNAFDEIAAACEQALSISLGFELEHIGINHPNEEEAVQAANRFRRLFRLNPVWKGSSVFAGTVIENMKRHGYGTYGHIGFSTSSMKRAMAYLDGIGIEFLPGSEKYDAEGNLTCVYLKDEIGGFAVHLMRKE